MKEKIEQLKQHVIEQCGKDTFRNHKWFVKYHLEIIEKLVNESLQYFRDANEEILNIMIWTHDYAKITAKSKEDEYTTQRIRPLLQQLNFEEEIIRKVMLNIDILDKKENLHKSPIEVQLMSSIDGVAHLIGPFFSTWYYENPQKDFESLMQDNLRKAQKDWNKKVILPLFREKFQERHNIVLEQNGVFPNTFLK
jgi:hypothetical protein